MKPIHGIILSRYLGRLAGREWVLLLVLGSKLAALAAWWAGWHEAIVSFWFFAPDGWVLWQLFVPQAAGLVPVVSRFVPRGPEIWLTIDDGPDPQDTPLLLAALARHGARATFFVIGAQAARYPEWVAEIVRQGHEIGHHTQTHPVVSFWCASSRRLARELDETLAVLAAGGVRPRLFRAPVGIKNLLLAKALRQRGLTCLAWTVRSGDTTAHCPERVLARILPRLRPGAIVLLHQGDRLHPAVRVEAITRLLEAVAARGLRCVIPETEQLTRRG